MRGNCWRRVLSVVVFWVSLIPALAGAEEKCRVLDPELQSSYLGPCNAQGLAEGLGVARGIAEYVGDFVAGRKHGRGVKSWPWGDRYVGEFREDAKHGLGLYVWGKKSPHAGDVYRGEFVHDKRHGRGSYLWASGERYDGLWENDQMLGPPTPMAIQRGRYFKALQEHVMKPGTVVCREVPIGLGNKQRIRGVVTRSDSAAMSLAVRLDQDLPYPLNGQHTQAGQELLDSAVGWEPCY